MFRVHCQGGGEDIDKELNQKAIPILIIKCVSETSTFRQSKDSENLVSLGQQYELVRNANYQASLQIQGIKSKAIYDLTSFSNDSQAR